MEARRGPTRDGGARATEPGALVMSRSAVRVRSSALLSGLEVSRKAMPRPRMELEPSLLQDVRYAGRHTCTDARGDGR
jgi:hypothetical protein